jgi:hypothetical protein
MNLSSITKMLKKTGWTMVLTSVAIGIAEFITGFGSDNDED